jgi:hypothetical protein
MTAEEKLVEEVALAVRDLKGGINYDYMDFCRDAARAVIPIVTRHCAEVARQHFADPAWNPDYRIAAACVADVLESIGKERG